MLKSKNLQILLPLIFDIGLTLGIAGCNKNGEAAPQAGGFAAPVTAISAVTADVPMYLDEIGKAVASESVTIQPQVSGVIVSRHFEDGADLKKGQLLFEVDPRPFQAALDQSKGQLAKDTAQKTSADWNVKQDEVAMKEKAISEQQLHNDTGTRDGAAGAIAVDQAQIAVAQLNLDYCSIKSPIDGRAGQRLVDVGNVVTAAGQAQGTNLLSIQTLDPVYADFTINESELPKVRQFMNAGTLSTQVQLPADAVGPSSTLAQVTPATTEPATMPTTQTAQLPVPRIGQLTFLDNAVQDGTGTIKLRATIPNSDHHFWPGQFVNVRLVLMMQKDAVLIPAAATQISQKGSYVYVVQPDSSAALVPITVGQRQGDMVVIESGLHAGDQVVLTGQLMIMPGGKVMVVNRASAGQTAGPAGPEKKPGESQGGAS